ncbi:exocyst complex component EXO70A1-like isoform X2 [Macadamia integrifolia]|uniref:exocyst complex component EXO70A1-like isoform X2 n=1 Tax=Macadamia integrifolia TaxID=60698 RepID=UPI001C4FBB15|nr:exocyst complex component EXO70A1-like isoform X2 [Macadamia integrifolia]
MESPDNISMEVEAAEKLIRRWDSTASKEARERKIFGGGDRQELDRYLRAVDDVQRSMESVSVSGDASPGVGGGGGDPGKVNGATQIAMAHLEDGFRNILIIHTNPFEFDSLLAREPTAPANSILIMTTQKIMEEEEELQEGEGSISNSGSRTPSYRSTRSIREIDLIPSEAIYDLRSIAQRMVTAGYLRECIQVYATVRKSAIDASFRLLGIEKLSIGDIQRLEWDVLESKIRRWIRAAKVCVRIIFASEKQLCEQIFNGLSLTADDACFMETVKGPASELFNFADAISISHRSPEKLFKMLDLYDALSDLLPDVEAVFHSKSSESVLVQAVEIQSQLAEAVRRILSEFENAVRRETSKTPVPGGTIHPLTRYVMNYINLISDYKQTLLDLIVSVPSTTLRYSDDPTTPDLEFPEPENRSPLALHLLWIIVILESNLEGKSKLYKDDSLTHLFLMNNVHYIVQKMKGSPELREMIGDDYLRKLMGKFRQEAMSYQRSTWVRILHSLRDEGLHVSGAFSSGVSKTGLRERFKTFNALFEEAHRTQATWLVPNPQLREELRISILEKLIPAYRSFLGRFKSHIENGKHPEMYIKHSVEDLETAVLNFFEGYQLSQHHRRR